jgi:hypothetical protein
MPTRRAFLGSVAVSTLAARLGSGRRATLPPGHPRVALLVEPGFPSVDTTPLGADLLGAALEGLGVTSVRVADLEGTLSPDRFDVLVTPYGSAFPKDAWPALLAYLDGGGNWVNLGGVPCAVPVTRGAGGWTAESRTTEYHHRLGVVLACAVPTAAVCEWRADAALPWGAELAPDGRVDAATVWELYYRLSSIADTPEESGSAGPREAAVRPLVTGVDADGWPIAVPFVLVDRLEREYAGGRWAFATVGADGVVAAAAVRALVDAASLGARQLEVRPSLACYRGGERPAVAVTYRAPRGGASPLAATCRLDLFKPGGALLARAQVAVTGTGAHATGATALDALAPGGLEPGLYRLEGVPELPGSDPFELRQTNGFWVWDARLVARGAPLGAGAWTLTRNGEPYPAAGTTYMASDVHRKFLLEPNPPLWDRDFAAMKRAGINLVRTGIWTGWKTLMPKVGEVDEGALRALDAFILTARRHDIPLIFTLFAFLPEAWGGENPYLDPVAVEAQRVFVTLIARRYGAARDLAWDLINEPSFCNKDHLWSCRPNYDRFEREAWATWLRQRRLPAAELPPLEAFREAAGAAGEGPARPAALEYRLFAQAMFGRWARVMRAALREAGSPRQLVTVGQDEAGTRESPNNLFLARDLDFTCIHTWWLNDDVVWDEVMTRSAGKANLVEETGVMFSAHPPGVEARWEEYARDLLERKMAIALGPGGAGFVEWVWNSNCYMPSDNEAAIGLLRADGSAKPELDSLRGVATFVAEAGWLMVGREEDPVLLVVPHADMFSTRNTATDATKRAVRAMQYGCRVGLGAISEYAVTPGMEVAPLVLVPSPTVLRRVAWEALLAWANRGSTVLVTGPVDRDEEWNHVDRLATFGITAGSRPVGTDPAIRIPLGRGALLWSPDAVEAAPDLEPTRTLYRWALAQAHITPPVEVEGADAGTLVHTATYREAALFTVVADRSSAHLRVRHSITTRTFNISVPAGRAALVMVGLRDGRVLARYSPA